MSHTAHMASLKACGAARLTRMQAAEGLICPSLLSEHTPEHISQ